MRLSSVVDLFRWGGKDIEPALNTSPSGSEASPAFRQIRRKFSRTLTTTPLPSGGTFFSPWSDTTITGTEYVSVSANYDAFQNAGSNGLYLEESDNPLVSGLIFTVQLQAQITTSAVAGPIRRRYWRTKFIVGVATQTVFRVDATESQVVPTAQGAISGGLLLGSGGIGGDGISNNVGPQLLNFRDATNTERNALLAVAPWIYNGASWDRPRTSNIFKTVSTAALGATVIWTPTSGKKFRLMRYQIEVQEGSTLAAGANEAITFLDNVTTIGFAHDVFIPAIALATDGVLYQSNWIDLGNGILSAAANNALSINLGTALATGGVRINTAGTEE